MHMYGVTAQQFDDNAAAGVDAGAILLELNYHRAVELARAGRYNEAEMLLQQIDKNRTLRPVILDLRAKMFAQQGRYAEAYACWVEALSMSPGNAEYGEAIEVLRANARCRPWLRLAEVAVITGALGLVVFGVFVLGLRAGTGRYGALQQRIIKPEVSISQTAGKEDVVEAEEQQGTTENELAEETTEAQQELVLCLENVSKQLNVLRAQNVELQQTIGHQSSIISDLNRQMDEVKVGLSASADSLTKQLDSLEQQDAAMQQILKEQHTGKGLFAGVTKILWAPIDLFLNIWKGHSKPKTDSAEQHKLQENHEVDTSSQNRVK